MADTTPEPHSDESTPGVSKKPGARKKAPAQKVTPPPALAAPPEPDVVATQDPEPAPASAPHRDAPAQPGRSKGGRSVLDSVRDNRMGPLSAGLLVAIAVGLLLSVLVPGDPNVLGYMILGVLLSAAVGFAVRLVSRERGLRRQAETFVATIIGVHLMSITGSIGGDIPLLSDLGVSGPGFNEALLVALATPSVSTGAVLAGLSAAIIVGWGRAGDRPAR